MTFVEFLEAFARVCEKANPNSEEELDMKIRNAMVLVVHNQMNKKNQSTFVHPSDEDILKYQYRYVKK
jgi:hypothetical protein